MVLPCLARWADTRSKLIQTRDFLFDENMIEWAPKNTRTGGLPNLTNEPRKPTPLGSMLRSMLCHSSRVTMAMEPMMPPEVMHGLPHFHETGNSLHVSQSLRLAELCHAYASEYVGWDNVEVKKNRGAHCRGDAFFGSVINCVEFDLRLHANTAFLLKNNKKDAPVEILKAIMASREVRTGSIRVATAMYSCTRL